MADPASLSSLPPAPPAADMSAPYLSGLNPAQRQAVEVTDGPLLVLAGAGTGKTRVLTTRLAHILLTRRAWPSQVLAVTFTNKAAREMRERVGAMIGGAVEGLWIGTFHAIGARLLRRHAELLNLQPSFTILDTDDQIRLLKQLLQAADLDEKRWPARTLSGYIQRWKDRGLTPDKVPVDDLPDFADGKALELYAQYQARLAALNACDFGDLLLHCLTLFGTHGDVLARYQEQFKYILVDEYQDTNVAQYLWLRLLAQTHRNLCCVGDDDQSIYSWRGAEVGNILRFEQDFPGGETVRLEQNYRSTGDILGAASGLIAHNSGRLGKTLWTDSPGGEKVVVRGVWDGETEARMIGEEVESAHSAGASLDDMAVLVRASFQMREFEERFLSIGVPYRVIGGLRFYERQEIRDAIAYLRLLNQPDDDLAFERIANVPRRGIGDATMQALHRLGRAEGVPLTEAARRLTGTDELRPQARGALSRLVADLDRWRALADSVSHVELAETVLDESGYTAMWQNDRSPDAPGRLENLKELIVALAEFENLTGFLEHVSLVMDNEDVARGNAEMVSLMTLHGAKGLEFNHVFLPGWEEGLFPHQRALDEGGTAALEEERRLAYVGLTRARQRAHVSFAANRRVYNQWQSALPSRFVAELPKDHIETVSEAGLFGAAASPGFAEDKAGFTAERPGRGAGYARWRNASQGSSQGSSPSSGGRGRVIEGAARAVADKPSQSAGGVRTGARVFHQKFGYGKVLGTDGGKLDIAFEKAGRKKVMESFVEAV